MKSIFAGGLMALACAAAYGQSPVITAVLDAGAYTPNLAPGIIFVVKGSNLCQTTGFTPATPPYSTSALGGASISLTSTSGGTAISAYMVYCYNIGGQTQLAAELPSTVSNGNYNLVVTSGGATSAPFQTTVVARKAELLSLAGSGSGRATLQNVISGSQYDVNGFSTGSGRSPAKPSQVLIAWATGLGAAVGFDASAPPALNFLDQGLDVKVIVGGVVITPFFAGRNNFLPGLDNIGFQLPANIPTGCTVSLQLRVAGQLSNLTTIAIAPPQGDACVSPQFPSSVLSKLDGGGTLTAGYFSLTSFATNLTVQSQTVSARVEGANGAFVQYTADTINQIPNLSAGASAGQCQVYTVTSQGGSGSATAGKALDAGVVTLNGPNVTNRTFTETSNTYSLSLGTAISIPGLPSLPGFNSQPLITAGTYRLSGAGGKDVGVFSANITIDQPLTVTGGLPASVNRSQDLPLAWTGGGTDIVLITGISSVATSGTLANGTVTTATFNCTTTADKGSFTVPTAILQQLPASPAGASSSTAFGSLSIFTNSVPSSGNGLFSAPLNPSGTTDYALFSAGIGTMASTTYQ